MYYYKQLKDNEIVSVEAKSRNTPSPGFVETTKSDYDTFIASLPPAEPEPPELTPDQARLAEIVALSPAAITMPDMWEAIRILAKLRGIE